MSQGLNPPPDPTAAPPTTKSATLELEYAAAPPRGPWGFWATIGLGTVIGLGWMAAQIAVVIAWAVISSAVGAPVVPEELEESGLLLALATCASAPVALGLTWLFVWLRRGKPAAEYLGFRRVSVKTVALSSLALVVFVGLSEALTALLQKPSVTDFMRHAYQTAGFTPLLWLTLVVVAPLTEETLCRGFIFEGIVRSRLGATGAIVLTALLWALPHFQYDAYGVATIFFFGLFLGFVRWKTGSLYVTLWLHALANLFATLQVVWVLR